MSGMTIKKLAEVPCKYHQNPDDRGHIPIDIRQNAKVSRVNASTDPLAAIA